ncbi:MAG: AzlD domain-containing protein [Alicyclobacillus sp.]|nr:AzlD domain-containing protein [Alicyclobacillus sp.]
MRELAYSAAIAAAGLATYLTRFPPMLLGRHLTLPPRMARGMRYIPIGVFAALVAPALWQHVPSHGSIHLPFWGATAVALCAAWKTKSPLWTMLAGVVCIAVLRAAL